MNHDSDVRYAPESGSRETPVALPLCADFVDKVPSKRDRRDFLRIPFPSQLLTETNLSETIPVETQFYKIAIWLGLPDTINTICRQATFEFASNRSALSR